MLVLISTAKEHVLQLLTSCRHRFELLINRKAKRTLYFFCVWCCLCVQFGCTTVPKQPVLQLNQQEQQTQLQQLQHWQIRGRIAITTPDDKVSAYINWSQTGQQFDIKLTNILGSTLVSLTGDDTLTTLVADDKTYQDSNPERLLQQITGLNLPVSTMPILMKGQLPDTPGQYQFSEQGLLKSFKSFSSDWQVQYQKHTYQNQQWLPQSMLLSDQHNNIKLRITKWTLL